MLRGSVAQVLLTTLLASHGGLSLGDDAVELKPLGDRIAAGGSPLIINGQPAAAGEYSVSFQYATSPTDVCTWFLVGPHVMVGAAHCASTKRKIKLTIDGVDYGGDCDVPTEYSADSGVDIALCEINPAFAVPRGPGIPVSGYEILNVDAAALRLDDRVEVTGFGCIEADGTVSTDYIVGRMRIVGLPPDVRVPPKSGLSRNSVKLRQGPSILCGGDSGGPAFIYYGSGRRSRVVIGVNMATTERIGASYLTSTSAPQILGFVNSWKSPKDEPDKKAIRRICGMDQDLKGCRPLRK